MKSKLDNITITSDEALVRNRLEFVISEIFQFEIPSIKGSSIVWRTQAGLHVHLLDNLKPNQIGRDPENSVCIDDHFASRKHSSIQKNAVDWILIDTGSRNGTWLNQKKIDVSTLTSGDVIKIGNTHCVFMDLSDSDDL